MLRAYVRGALNNYSPTFESNTKVVIICEICKLFVLLAGFERKIF